MNWVTNKIIHLKKIQYMTHIKLKNMLGNKSFKFLGPVLEGKIEKMTGNLPYFSIDNARVIYTKKV